MYDIDRIDSDNDNNKNKNDYNNILAEISHIPQSSISRQTSYIGNAMLASASVLLAAVAAGQSANAAEGSVPGVPLPRPAIRPHLYSVEFASPPYLQPRTKQGEIGAIEKIGLADIVILGGHSRQPSSTGTLNNQDNVLAVRQ